MSNSNFTTAIDHNKWTISLISLLNSKSGYKVENKKFLQF